MSDNCPELPAAYNLVMLEEVTNLRRYAAELGAGGAEEGTILCAGHQSSARGRLNREWYSSDGDLHCSIILRPDFAAEFYPQLMLVATVGMGNALATHLSPMIALAYRWPNDITIASHKVAGIWIDCDVQGNDPWLTVTASVNIRNSPDDFSIPAMSISEAEGGTELTSQQLLETFARQFITQINFWSERGMPALVKLWKIRAEGVGEDLSIEFPDEKVSGIVSGFCDDGDIVLTTSKGTSRTVTLAEFAETNKQLQSST